MGEDKFLTHLGMKLNAAEFSMLWEKSLSRHVF